MFVQDFYPEDAAHCYGCGRLNPDGYHLKTAWDGLEGITRFEPRPAQTSMPGFVYGGLLASLIDCHAMATAAAATEAAAGRRVGAGDMPRFVTAALHVDYLRPTPLGLAIELRGRVKDSGPRKVVVEVTVAAAGEITVRGEVVAVRLPDNMR
ncbi:MAG TPA: hotdog domain-containing protein [Vicinamibacterales bacterium]|nr:hotdog domain-containing protein [Vicinamibacterales bacterium]